MARNVTRGTSAPAMPASAVVTRVCANAINTPYRELWTNESMKMWKSSVRLAGRRILRHTTITIIASPPSA